jgi:hypothetical protein
MFSDVEEILSNDSWRGDSRIVRVYIIASGPACSVSGSVARPCDTGLEIYISRCCVGEQRKERRDEYPTKSGDGYHHEAAILEDRLVG